MRRSSGSNGFVMKSTAPSFIASTATKVAVYVLIRFFFTIFGEPPLVWLLLDRKGQVTWRRIGLASVIPLGWLAFTRTCAG